MHVDTIATGLKPLSRLSHPREVVRQFTPNWFAATMGTGILALALAQFPVYIPGLKAIAEGLWFFNILLFGLFSILYAARWVFFFDGARRIFGHSVVSMFFGCIPMGLATIINGFLVFGLPRWGHIAIEIATVLWYVDAVLAFICGVTIPYLMFTRQNHSVDQMTAVWLLPVVAAEVTAASGGFLVPHLPDSITQLSTIIASYALWACSVPVAMSILVILLLRMALYKLPHVNMAASCWLALGPIGTGALGLLVLGDAAPEILIANNMGNYADGIRGFSLITGVMLWGYGLWWISIAMLITHRYLRDGFPFNLGWWGYTFPIGVYAVATLKLSTILPIIAFKVFGGILVIILAVMWLIVGKRTVCGAWRGELFVSPCLKDEEGIVACSLSEKGGMAI
ncbi:MAG: TDT family transporter [Proteobacteria bacterium]|nr:TDT family transporter [Pseudomonadota bacterium]